MFLSISDLQKDTMFLLEGAPYKILDLNHKKMARQGAVLEVKCRNLINKNTITKTFSSSDKFEELDLVKKDMLFLYNNKNNYCFVDVKNKSDRMILHHDKIKDFAKYLTPNLNVVLEYFNDDVINVVLPIKVDMSVIEAPPSIRGNTAQGGTKNVTVETGALIKTPLFINKGDVIRINTQKGEYVERIKKN